MGFHGSRQGSENRDVIRSGSQKLGVRFGTNWKDGGSLLQFWAISVYTEAEYFSCQHNKLSGLV